MSLPDIFFKGLLDTLAGQLFGSGQEHADCFGDGFGGRISRFAKEFFSVSVVEVDLRNEGIATLGILVDNSAKKFRKTRYTFFIFVDASKKYAGMTNDLKRVFKKAVLAHETCHFVFYQELFSEFGGDSTDTTYTQFQRAVSGNLKGAITKDADATSQTVVDEHKYLEFLRNFLVYDNSHWDLKGRTKHNYTESNENFFGYLTVEQT